MGLDVIQGLHLVKLKASTWMIREKSLFIIHVCIPNEIQDELTLYNYNLIRNYTIIGELVPTSAPLLNKMKNGNVHNCEIADFFVQLGLGIGI